MVFTHLREPAELWKDRDPETTLQGAARDWLLSEEWGYARLGKGEPVQLVGTIEKPGLDVQAVIGVAYGRWWSLRMPAVSSEFGVRVTE